ncbi:family 16 glycosylhydrolase [Microvirga sp. 2YAF29]|uniref:family 16 glycosylhydrolase n=1 Tax=Microvirga sp. 2YAF29 TaxID=3233031 RepID=UPI003F99FAAA
MALSINTWTKQYAGTPLNLSGYTTTFHDSFDTLSISPNSTGTRWSSGGTYDFGSATFEDSVGADGPFKVANGNLTIKMEKVGGKWQSGAIQSVNGWGAGFAQQYGYFEVRAKFPEGYGSWPAFFLNSQNRYGNPTAHPSTVRTEFDIVEAYGGDPDGHHTVAHIRQDSSKAHLHQSLYSDLPGSMFDGQFHTYGGLVTPDWMITYMDGKEIARMKTVDAFKTPLYMVLDLAMLPAEASKASGTYEMVVDYVKAYASGSSSPPPMPIPNTPTGPVTLNGKSSNDVLTGTKFADKLYGHGGNDQLKGLDGNDTLDGGAGADTMIGGAGDDTYYVDNVGDVIIEESWSGSDTVMSTIDFTLSTHLNNITLLGSANINGTGNSSDNVLVGNWVNNKLSGGGGNDRLDGRSGNDTLDGGAGNDTLTGGAGHDVFVFSTSRNASNNVDRITDFSIADDTIHLKSSVFPNASLGTLASDAFVTGTRALDSGDRVIYGRAQGKIYYDADGTGSAAAVLFAQVNKGLALTHADFMII